MKAIPSISYNIYIINNTNKKKYKYFIVCIYIYTIYMHCILKYVINMSLTTTDAVYLTLL